MKPAHRQLLAASTLVAVVSVGACGATTTSTARPTGQPAATSGASPIVTTTLSTSSGPSTRRSGAESRQRVLVTARAQRTVVHGATVQRRHYVVTPTGSGTTVAAKAIEARLNQHSAAMAAEWTSALEQNPSPPAGSGPGGYEETSRVVTDEGDVLALAPTFYENLPGAAHPLTLVRALTFDTRTGAEITPAAMLAEMQRLGGPRWDFERELRRGASRAVPQESSATLTRRDVSLWPQHSGMAVGVDRCAFYGCASGLVEFTLPWASLVGPGDRLSFRPDSWEE